MTAFFAPESVAGDGFQVRCYRPGDGPALQAATVASYAHLKPFMPWATASQTVEEAEALARRFRANYLLGTDFVFAVVDAADTRVLGGTGFHLREGPIESACAEIGMWIAADQAGKGLGTAVLKTMLAWGFSAWPWLRLSWLCNVENAASRRVAEKAGMALEGVLRGRYDDVTGGRRDMAAYAILKEEWATGPDCRTKP